MNLYHLMSFIITFAIGVAYINLRFTRMPMAIAVMFSSLVLSIILLFIGKTGNHPFIANLADLINKINFHDFLMNGILSYLLFAGGLTINISHLKNKKWEISILACLSTIASAGLIGMIMYYLLPLFHINLPLIFCFLFGALISPTDPIAVLSIFKALKAPQELSILLEGESLFNDGVGIVIFLIIYQVAFQGVAPTWQAISVLFLKQALGGIVYGFILGRIALYLIKPIQAREMALLITLAIVSGGYALANYLTVSGPLAMVVAGIIIGNQNGEKYLTRQQHDSLEVFWGVIDEIFNAVLFFLIGFELFTLNLTLSALGLAIAAIIIVLLVRFICVAAPLSAFKHRLAAYWQMVFLLTWGGLRGGLAVALALALPASTYRNTLLTMTYAVVVFAILIQGMTVKPLILRCLK